MLSFRWYAKQLKKSHKATRYYEIATAGHIKRQLMIAAAGAKFRAATANRGQYLESPET